MKLSKVACVLATGTFASIGIIPVTAHAEAEEFTKIEKVTLISDRELNVEVTYQCHQGPGEQAHYVEATATQVSGDTKGYNDVSATCNDQKRQATIEITFGSDFKRDVKVKVVTELVDKDADGNDSSTYIGGRDTGTYDLSQQS
ncbi:hypothetical protein [Nocardia brasiliensis]|uniref:hypothetical protein n=1 Tax=Nocardia brasiliensis TaxID=37326 RepID=UPI002458306C|nr:hypothetical protein [Nocardia brasiliensis]